MQGRVYRRVDPLGRSFLEKISRMSIYNSLRGRLHLLVHCRPQSGTAVVNLSSFLRTSPSPITIHFMLFLSVLLPVLARVHPLVMFLHCMLQSMKERPLRRPELHHDELHTFRRETEPRRYCRNEGWIRAVAESHCRRDMMLVVEGIANTTQK